MLEAAIKYQKTFDRLEMKDKKYVDDLRRGMMYLENLIVNEACSFLPFLKMFYDATMQIYGFYYVSIYIYIGSIFNW